MARASSSDDLVLQVSNLSVAYSGVAEPILTNVSLDVRAGEAIGIIGISGSGKTTLAKAILDSLGPSATVSGLINYRPKRPMALSRSGSRFRKGSDISLLTQEPWSSLNPAMSIKKQFEQAILAHHPHLGREGILEKTLHSLSAVGLVIDDEKLKHYPKEFSGGQQQRICIALSLLHEPKLLIADEPISSLDETAGRDILDLLFQKQSMLGNAIVLISHDDQQIFARCKKVYKLENGSLALADRPATFEFTPPIGQSLYSEEQLISATNLSFWRDESHSRRPIFEGVSFNLAKGQRLGISGISGAGKSTLARVLTGLERPSAGKLTVLGKDLFTKKLERGDRAKLALIFQDSSLSLNPKMTIGQILLEPLLSHNVSLTKLESKSRIEKALSEVGLVSTLVDSYPRFLSGGQRQRINIARSLMLEPELLIADEPMSSLDYENTHRVLSLLDSLQAEYGFALVLVSHNRKLLGQYTERVLEINSPVPRNFEI